MVSQDTKMVEGFKAGQDAYAMIASVSFNKPYEECLEFHPETHEYQPDGKERRTEAKSVLLGVLYGRSIPSIGDQLYSTRDDMTDEQKTKAAQKVYDAVMAAFPGLRNFMIATQQKAKALGYTETILGRRRHVPDMQLEEFEFKPMKGYINPDIDPLDINTLNQKDEIPERIVNQLKKEFASYKYFGQIAKRTKELYEEEHIRVINNRPKINDATRQCVNSVVQGSAADLTKMAILELENDEGWKRIGGKLLLPVHDELIAEVPMEYMKEGEKILADCMCRAADFMPFEITCDVETTFRWYGLSVEDILSFDRPSSLDTSTMSESNIKWIQSRLCEMEYLLPVIKNPDGSKPRGVAAKGVNGIWNNVLDEFIDDYCFKFRVSRENFLDDIDRRVVYGSK